MTVFRDQKVLRRLRRIGRGLSSLALVDALDTNLIQRMRIVSADIDGLIDRVGRCTDFHTRSGTMLRGNVVKALIEIVAINVLRTKVQTSITKQFRGLFLASTEMLNDILIADPDVISPGDMSAEWAKTRRGNSYRRHESGAELVIEVFPNDGCVCSIGEVAVLSGLNEIEARLQLDAFADELFAPVLRKQKELQMFQAALN